VGKLFPNIVIRVNKVTCKPLDKGQKSTKCTSLRKLLGIFTHWWCAAQLQIFPSKHAVTFSSRFLLYRRHASGVLRHNKESK